MPQLLIAHADGEERLADEVAGPLEAAGYEISHAGRVVVGDSVVGEAAKVLEGDVPVVLCATVRAIGTPWAHTVVNAARSRNCPVYPLQMEREANVRLLTFDERVLEYWRDSRDAMKALLMALADRYPVGALQAKSPQIAAARERYRELALAAVDIIDLANLPELDRHVATRQLELRKLYVPLHVTTEAAPGQEIDESKLAELEERRKGGGPEAHAGARVPIGERLGASRRLIVLGDPGAGKTTMIRWLATAYLLRLYADPAYEALPGIGSLPAEDLLPIIVRCRDLDEDAVSGSLDDVLRRTFRKSEMTAEEADALMIAFREDLRDGRALLLVDGLDEIQDPAQRARFCAQLEQIHIAHPHAFLVATSRIVGYREMGTRIGRGFEHVTVADLSSDDKDDFARRWCALTEPPQRRETAAQDLINDIHSGDRIERLTGNPMLLTTMALVKRKVGKLPSGRAELYGDAVDVLLRWRREVDEPIDQREALPQLQYVAYAMCERGVQLLRESEILELLYEMREEYGRRIRPLQNHSPEEFLQLLERRTGILIQAGSVRDADGMQPVYEFRHLTFQEYLAATALVKGRYPHRDASLSLGEAIAPLAGLTTQDDDAPGELGISENWREALQLCVAVCEDDDVDDAIEAIMAPLPGEDPAVARPRALLAASCLTDEPNVSEDVARAVLEALCAVIDERDGQEFGFSAVDGGFFVLAQMQWQPVVIEALAREFGLRELPSRVNVGGVFSLAAWREPPETVVGLREWLEGIAADLDAEPTFVLAALRLSAFGKMRSTVRYLAEAIDRTRHELLVDIQSRLTEATGGGDTRATAALLALVRLTTSDLGELPETPRLLEILEDPGSPSEHLVLTLQAFASPRRRSGIAAGWRARLGDAVSALYRHADPGVRLAALESLRYATLTGAATNVHDRLSDLATDEDPQIRSFVAEALPVDADWLDVMRGLANDPDPKVLRSAFFAAGAHPDGDALFHEALGSADAERRRQAVNVLAVGRAAPESTVPLLLRMAESPEEEERLAALAALRDRPEPAVRELIRATAENPSAAARTRAAEWLSPEDEEEETLLIALARDEDGGVRGVAIQRLAASPSPQSWQVLRDGLSDLNQPVRQAAVNALVASEDADLVRAAIESLRDVGTPAPSISVPWTIREQHADLYAELLELVDAASRGSILGAIARTRQLPSDDQMIISKDFDGLSPYLDPTVPVSSERIADVAELLDADPEEIRARYRAIADRVGIMVPGWA